ncbi:RNA polymerase RpoN-/SigL-like sigma 54 subunit [Alicyclobacillus sacchari]|uniref:RNA polymerase RpoN-/SigL-like sigma 54 subunit n=1 Tax=Alicyclobacillus sacchari TaxID=392010 RepID=A0A4R8LSG7_9BACL|nr:RNA polymerase factor sigma-54 [Alicyclobacillus sacchari]TDY50032.1 RNA polymerase RpoN-/SigL-like sigma 54 subunit [Alicyclobacillus sacchari]GMA57638.1 RNA polymerase sigma-54 factor [Alicyclobacillus sacchari]
MDMAFCGEMQQTQRLVMTAEMRQALAVLQSSSSELADMLEHMAQDNPCLEWEWPWAVASGEFPRQGATAPWSFDAVYQYPAQRTLADELCAQLRVMPLPSRTLRVAQQLACSLDERGYCTDSLDVVAVRLGVPVREVEEALSALQDCEPSGVGARNLEECLILQLDKIEPPYRTLARKVIDHLNDLGQGKLRLVARNCHVSLDEIYEVLAQFRRLTPRPGAAWCKEPLSLVPPDVVVEQAGDAFMVRVHESAEPRLWVSPSYRALWISGGTEVRAFLAARLRAIERMAKAIETRRMTMLRVAEVIVARQLNFLRHGPGHMRPLTLREVAQELEMHESTVSRAIRNKSMKTPFGVWAMDAFFPAQLAASDFSAEAVQHLMRSLIALEDARNPLSDAEIVLRLAKQGVALSRRTVAKYREQMGIPSSQKRRR